ncbi:phosphate ABC transporter permease PstA [Anaerosoma tenue]|uniref:phosphate ABC transporter permease PstA n=1 Tax=Anaerosoma tenue TaxID=2933588 RepID=UPI002260A7F7|nr:phosphate ABC transporter permease PstA [Anaerosoma tenue]MCK8115569.1 phosphate ABC transporter permease PstA [Anaerosoma tenue]
MSGMSRTRRARRSELVARAVTGLAAVSVVAVALFVLAYIVYHGIGAIDWTFLTDVPRDRGREGGILPVIVGTLWVVATTAGLTLPIGILAGIYLSEYAPRNFTTRAIRLAITNMAGVPSIVYGLFGLAAFVLLAGFGRSVIASALTLTCMTLPVVITATEEALRQIPQDLRQASLALGATRLRTIYKVVLPAAAPGIITGSILGLARAAGETAPILFTGAVFQMRKLPDGLSSQFMSLPYHIYAQVTSVPGWSPTLVWGTALVLVAGVSVVSVVAALWRSAQRRRVKW